MANTVKSYFFPPQWDYQLGGPIALGSIIADPRQPELVLQGDDTPRPPLPRLSVNHNKPNFKATIRADDSVSGGIGTSLLQLFGFGVDFSAERGNKRVYMIEAENLSTQEITPKASFVELCFKDPEVERYLQKSRLRKEVYMITGIMSATRATVSSDIGKKRLFDTQVGIDFTAATGGAAPVGLHVKGGHNVEHNTEVSFGQSDFILGYKIQRIIYMKTSKIKRMEEYAKHTVLAGNDNDEAVQAEVLEEFHFRRLEDDLAYGDDFGLSFTLAQSEDTDVPLSFVVPTEEAH